ncbi:lysis protein, partial [Bacteroides fragilis]
IGIFIGIANGDIKWVAGLVDGVIAGAVSVGGNELAKSLATMFNGGAK